MLPLPQPVLKSLVVRRPFQLELFQNVSGLLLGVEIDPQQVHGAGCLIVIGAAGDQMSVVPVKNVHVITGNIQRIVFPMRNRIQGEDLLEGRSPGETAILEL